MRTAEQIKRKQTLDEEWIEDVSFVFYNIHNCVEVEALMDMDKDWWNQCPLCGAYKDNDGRIKHRKQ